ncbi:luciferin 4-monooxygenase-like [Haemaphysalis longicornis]
MRARVENGIVHSPYGDCPPEEGRSAYAVLMESLEAHGSKTAVIFTGGSITYQELQEKLRRCVAGFRSRGIGPGDRFYAHLENDIDNLVALLSIPLTGATLLSSDIWMRRDEILARMKQGQATHVLTVGGYAEDFEKMAQQCGIKELFLVGEKKSGFTCVSDFYATQCLPRSNDGFVSGGCSFINWTTGTSGPSKYFEIPERIFLQQTACRAAVEIIRPDDVLISTPNILSSSVFYMWFLGLHVGATMVIREVRRGVPILPSQVENVKAVKMISVPSQLRCMLNAMKTPEFSDSPLRKCLKKLAVIGSSMPPALVKELRSTFQLEELRSVYGMSEVGGPLTSPPPGDVSGLDVGFPVPGTRMKIVDPVSGNVLGPMERGEVLFDTPYKISGYIGNPEATAAFIDDQGWIHTADLGYYNQDGRLFLCGRLNVVINCFGRKVHPAEVESHLLEHPAVEQAAVLGVPFPEMGQAPAAIVVLTHGYSPDEQLAEELKEFVCERLPVFQHLHGGVYFTDKLPINYMGKVRRSLLPDLLGTLHRMDCAKFSLEKLKF